LGKAIQRIAKTGSVLLRDSEDAGAALGAADTAYEMFTAAARGVAQRRIHDLDKVGHGNALHCLGVK
jgi:hypothetical protein